MKEYVRRMISEKSDLSARVEKAKKAIENPPYGMTAYRQGSRTFMNTDVFFSACVKSLRK